MKAIVFMLAVLMQLFLKAATTPGGADNVLARALVLAYQGKLTDPNLISEIEKRFRTGKDTETRAMAALLLTYAPTRSLPQGMKTYVDFALDADEKTAYLDAEGRNRLLRLQGDEAFEHAKFDLAKISYGKLARTKNTFLSNYAKLKLGWCSMNQAKPADAFHLWAESLESMDNGAGATPALLRSFGQAFTENQARNQQDLERLMKLELTSDQMATVIDGMVDGLDLLVKPEQLATYAHQVVEFPLHADLVKNIFEKSSGTPVRACQLLVFLDEKTPEALPQEPYGRLIQGCVESVTTGYKDKAAFAAAIDRLKKALPLVSFKGTDRRFRFDFNRAIGQNEVACREGLDWLKEKVDGKAVPAPIKPIAESCAAAAADPAFGTTLLTTLSDAAKSGNSLSDEKSPMTFIATYAISTPNFRSLILEEMKKSPETFTKTLLPDLMAERLDTEKDFKSAYALLGDYHKAGREVSKKSDAVWSTLEKRQLTETVASGNLDEAKALLDQKLPCQKGAISADTIRNWTNWVMRAKTESKQRASVVSAVECLLDPEHFRIVTDAQPAILGFGAELKLWEPLWKVASISPLLLTKGDRQALSSISSKPSRKKGLTRLISKQSGTRSFGIWRS